MTDVSPDASGPSYPPSSGRLEQAVARIRAGDGTVVGLAFQVSAHSILTCAHVVERAQGAAAEPITVEFPLLPGSAAVPVRVTVLCPG
jgi:hypothetical protein